MFFVLKGVTMAYFLSTTAYGSAGTKTITVGFQPVRLKITVAQKFATAQAFSHSSEGVSNGTLQFCTSLFQDTTGGQTLSLDNKIISHYERVGGVLTEVLSATINSFTATQVKINVVIPNANYNLLVEVEGWPNQKPND